MNQLFLRNTWGDGLPVNPPTGEQVEWILKGAELPRDQYRQDHAQRRHCDGGLIAVSLAMAVGARIPAGIDCRRRRVSRPSLEHDKLQATSGSTFPVIIVNGPIAKEIGNSASACWARPAASGRQHRTCPSLAAECRRRIGRRGTMAIFGGMRFTNAVFRKTRRTPGRLAHCQRR